MARIVPPSALAALVRALSLLLSLVLILSPSAAQEGRNAAERIVSRARLPVLGTVGDLPSKSESVEIELAAGGRLRIGGKPVDLAGLPAALVAATAGRFEETGAKMSRLHAVVRVDRDARWQDVRGLLRACADPSVRVFRVLFAAVPEDGGEEGAMALYLPCDRGVPGGQAPAPPSKVLAIQLRDAEPAVAPPGSILWVGLPKVYRGETEAGGQGRAATLAAGESVSAGAVLETVDVLFRGGTRRVLLRDPKEDPAAPPLPPDGDSEDRPEVLLSQRALRAPAVGDPVPPRVPRVRGALAGQTEPPPPSLLEAAETPPPPRPVEGFFEHRNSRRLRPDSIPIDPASERAVDAGLAWLRNHQLPTGHWDCDGFGQTCGGRGMAACQGKGNPLFDPGVTGLALLAFLARGESHKTPTYGTMVRIGFKYLKGIQDPEGCFGPRTSNHFTYNHALATLALVEAYGVTLSPLFKASAQNGVNFILQCRNPDMAWRYGVRPSDNDTSVTGWMVTALKAAEIAGLDVPQDAFTGALAWIDKVTEPEYGRTGYTARGNGPARPQELMDKFPMDRSESLTAIGVFVRLLCGALPEDALVGKGADLCANCLPQWDLAAGRIDFDYWHFGSLVMFQLGGERWQAWDPNLRCALITGQRSAADGDAAGSWDPIDPWGADGGRVYSTAMGVLCLETPYRYGRISK